MKKPQDKVPATPPTETEVLRRMLSTKPVPHRPKPEIAKKTPNKQPA